MLDTTWGRDAGGQCKCVHVADSGLELVQGVFVVGLDHLLAEQVTLVPQLLDLHFELERTQFE